MSSNVTRVLECYGAKEGRLELLLVQATKIRSVNVNADKWVAVLPFLPALRT